MTNPTWANVRYWIDQADANFAARDLRARRWDTSVQYVGAEAAYMVRAKRRSWDGGGCVLTDGTIARESMLHGWIAGPSARP